MLLIQAPCRLQTLYSFMYVHAAIAMLVNLLKATPTESVVSRPPPASCLSICIESPFLSLFSNYAKNYFQIL